MFGPFLPSQTPTGLPSDAFSEFDEAMGPAYESQKAALQARGQQEQQVAQALLERAQGAQNPVPDMAVPPSTNPLMAGLAGFFAHLNASQSGSGAAPAALANTLAQQQAYRHQAEVANAESKRAFALSKFEQTEKAQELMLKVVKENAIQQGDLKAAYDASKAEYALGEKRFKRHNEITQTAKDELSAANSKRILERSIAIQKEHERRAASSLPNKIKYQQDLIKYGLKASPSTIAKERTVRAEAAAQIASERQNATTGFRDVDEDLIRSIQEKMDSEIDALYADELTTIDKSKGVTAIPSHKPTTPTKPTAAQFVR